LGVENETQARYEQNSILQMEDVLHEVFEADSKNCRQRADQHFGRVGHQVLQPRLMCQ
jgi:hypothetical protein